MRHRERNMLKYQTYCEGVTVLPRNSGECEFFDHTRSLWYVLKEYVAHFHGERPHQGKGNVILFPSARPDQGHEGPTYLTGCEF
jgi:3',5'-cyclic AMP phosphodiesterase CpdA